MSAFPDEPDHFRAWAGVHDSDFVPRHRFAAYLRDSLDAAIRKAENVRIEHRRQQVAHLTPTAPVTLDLADGSRSIHDDVVVATGNAHPTRPDWLPEANRVVSDPWAPGALATIPDGARVACIGTGLTFVDIALTLARRGVHVHGFSRHGLLPAVHATVGPVPVLPDGLRTPVQILRWIRSHDDWRAALAALRPHTQRLWHMMTEDERRRFVRLPLRYWEIHRHRMAPEIGTELHNQITAGTIAVSALRPAVATMRDDGRITLIDKTGESTDAFDCVVVCTGPNDDARRSGGLLARLVESGTATPGPLGLGVATEPVTGGLLDTSGSPAAHVYCIGTMRRGTLWETTAIPELRLQAIVLAEQLVETGS